MTSVRPSLLLCGVGLIAAARAAALDLPVRYPDREPLTAPAYRGDALLITLRPPASAGARRARPPAAAESAAPAARTLGLPGVDRLAATLGGARFERVFAGESAPPAGSDEPDFTAFFRVHLPPGTVLEEALERFAVLPEVAAAEPIAVLRVSATPDDSVWTQAWWYHGATGGIRAPLGWDVTTGDTSLVIAIVDTGVLPYHPDLGGATAGLTGQLWSNWAERSGIPGFDDDGNGRVDDVAGWDFVNFTVSPGVADGEDWETQDNDPSDFAGHGTRVAGLAGALTDNGIGIAGTAWSVRLMPLRIGWSGSSPGTELGIVDMSFAAAAIRYATRMGATVINCSFETRNQGDLFPAVTAAVRAGITIVCSAGNTGQFHELQDRIDVISVTANGADDRISSTALTGSFVDLTAPGAGITTTALLPTGADNAGPRLPSYATSSGTSYAAPFVAGAAALVQARQRALGERPLGALSMMFRMRETADDVSAANPGVTGYGTGRLNLLRALTEPPTSFARRVGGVASGPSVVLPALSGRPRMAFATNDRRVLLLDAQTADSLAVATLPAVPARQVAAADMGGGRGTCLFVGLMQGRVAGFDDRLRALPGWPVTGPGTLYRFDAGPALGDLDGDGVLEVVCGSDNGEIWAWRVDGSVVDGFPVSSGTQAQTGPVALSDLDGVPGVEIVAASRSGSVTVFRHDGSELPNWPVAAGATTSPLVVSLGASGTSVVVGAGANVKAYAPDGTPRFVAPVPGSLMQDPAAGDLDGDGVDEIVAASATTIAFVDAVGNTPVMGGWPRTLPGAPAGPVLVGRLQAGARPGVFVAAAGTQVALDHLAQPLRQFPKPGVPGLTPALVDLDGDGRTEMIAGTAPDSTLFVYDAGADTWGAGDQPWGTPRANFARTGSRLYTPAIGAVDDVPPGIVTSLAADSALAGEVVLRWTAPGDDGASGTASEYQIQMTTLAGSAGDFVSGSILVPSPPGPAGTPERHVVRGLAPGTRYYFGLRSRDDAGNWSAASNLAAVLTPLGGPRSERPEGAAAIVARVDPGRLPLQFDWWAKEEAPGVARRIDLYDVSGRRVRRISLPAGDEGVARWDGNDEAGRRLPAGLYFARLTSGSLRAQARVVLIP